MGEEPRKPHPIYQPDSVTAEWLTEVLSFAGLLDGAAVAGFERQEIGTGQVGANIRFRLRYDDSATNAPASIVAKFASADEASRMAGIITRTYETEVDFYRDVADTVDISRPACYFASIESGTADVVLVMEDLAPAEQGNQIAGCDIAHAESAIDEAARLHGPRWGDPSLLDHEWLQPSPERSQAVADLYTGAFDGFVQRYRERLDPFGIEIGQRLKDNIDDLIKREPTALSLVHNDFRLDNMLFGPGERDVKVVDWQTVRLGCGTADVAYFTGTGLEPELRRQHDDALVRRYHEGLGRYISTATYSFEDCWQDYRRHSVGGFVMAVIASMLVGRTDRGDDMFMAMANRSSALAADVAALDFY